MKDWTNEDKIKIILILITIMIIICLFVGKANAQTYNNNYDLFENEYTKRLINMGINQIENFENKDYIIIEQNEYDYYLITGKTKEKNDNQIKLENTTIIRYWRTNNNYNYYWTYNTWQETETTINKNYITISNIKGKKTINSEYYNETKKRYNIQIILMFIMGIALAIFLTKERSSY